jgi:hypothetical protein
MTAARPSAKQLVAYGCGSPIRQPFIQAMAKGAKANFYVPEGDPTYRGGDSIIWGLIRGAPSLMQQTRNTGCDFFQMDNAYFGRDHYYRVTKNTPQLTRIDKRDHKRFEATFRDIGFSLQPWKKNRSGPIVFCLSSHHLFNFYGLDIEQWIGQTAACVRALTNRPMQLRPKHIVGIEQQIADAWCVVTHVSAAALDALRLGIPVVTTGECAATPLATPIEEIDNPRLPDGREELFASLAWGQFTPEEMSSGMAWNVVSGH